MTFAENTVKVEYDMATLYGYLLLHTPPQFFYGH
jgi:hypothetical protein